MNELKCPECGSLNIRKNGFKLTRKGQHQQYQCKQCGRVFLKEYSEHGKAILKGRQTNCLG